tara:strand:- start:1879 stop:2055 length:177 start_codon:yes stop_codon:yes gene_type:complete
MATINDSSKKLMGPNEFFELIGPILNLQDRIKCIKIEAAVDSPVEVTVTYFQESVDES